MKLAIANADKTSILQFPQAVLGAVAIFFHVGAQVVAIDTVIGYATSMGLSILEAKVFPSYILTATIYGLHHWHQRHSLKWIRQVNAFRICTLLGLTFSLLLLTTSGRVTLLGHTTDISLWFLISLGLANSLIWAGIWPLALDGLGRFTKVGASLLIMGLCGNALMPLVYGYFADVFGTKHAYWLLPGLLYLPASFTQSTATKSESGEVALYHLTTVFIYLLSRSTES